MKHPWCAPHRGPHPPAPEWLADWGKTHPIPTPVRPKPAPFVDLTNWFVVRKRREYVEMGFPNDIAKEQAAQDLEGLIRRACAAGATQKQIAKALRITAPRVHQLAKRNRHSTTRGPLIGWGERLDPDWIKLLRKRDG